MRAFLRILVASVVIGTTSGIALAADPSPQDIAQARELGQQAQAAFDAGSFAESEKLWLGASGLYPAAPTLTLGLARTQAKLGKLVLAQENYNKIIREGQSPSAPQAFKDAVEAAKNEISAVSAKIANVVITVEGAPNPTVTIDGQAVAAAGIGLRRPVDPGQHTVKAEAPGYKSAETTFQVAESGSAEAKLKLEKTADAPIAVSTPAAPAQETKPAAVSTEQGSNKTLAIVALGVGGAGLVLGAVTGAMAMGKSGDLDKACPGGKCPSSVKDDVDSYNTMGTLSTVGFIVGGVGLAAGAVLWFTAPKEKAAARSEIKTGSVAWQPYVGAGSGGVTGRF